jgi:D-methionine transport system substrate-binding protein
LAAGEKSVARHTGKRDAAGGSEKRTITEEESMLKRNTMLVFVLMAILLAGFTLDARAKAKAEVLIIGATPVPHAEILEQAKVLLKRKGIDLQIKVFTDYMTPDLALQDKSLDANYFQHLPYLENFNKAHGTTLVAAGAVHYEPLGVYAAHIKALGQLHAGDKVAIPNDVTNEARALILLQDNGILKLKNPKDLNATVKDVQSYAVKITLVEIEAAQLPRVLNSVAAAVINGNYAIDAGFSPLKDALAAEGSGSVAAKTYANIVAVRQGETERQAVKELLAVLHSPEIREFIKTRYKGAVVSVQAN